MNKKILIIAGDPNSINSEIICKAWKKLNKKIKTKLILIANYNLILTQVKNLKINIKLNKLLNINTKNVSNALNIIDFPINFKDCFQVSKLEASKYVIGCLKLAHKLSEKKKVSGFINCPIDKILIKKKNILGVTEFIAKEANLKNSSEVMFLHNKKLSVVPITTHIQIKDVSKKINKKLIITKVKTLNNFYKKLFRKEPKIAVLGINPHNGELSKNSEEVKKIVPAIKILKKTINIFGPFPSDSFFIDEYKKFDVIVGMYHDQVLVPFKSLFKFDAINITLGLKYIRISPDHGTAKNLIGKNKANPLSLIKCIDFINKSK